MLPLLRYDTPVFRYTRYYFYCRCLRHVYALLMLFIVSATFSLVSCWQEAISMLRMAAVDATIFAMPLLCRCADIAAMPCLPRLPMLIAADAAAAAAARYAFAMICQHTSTLRFQILPRDAMLYATRCLRFLSMLRAMLSCCHDTPLCLITQSAMLLRCYAA